MPTIPAQRYFLNSYLRYLRYPSILIFQYLPYPLNQVFLKLMPTIPTHTAVREGYDAEMLASGPLRSPSTDIETLAGTSVDHSEVMMKY